ncbi:hypothetical protein EMIT0194P_160077 [Pseudomonas serbica]
MPGGRQAGAAGGPRCPEEGFSKQMSLFFSLGVTVPMQVHLDAPQTDLNRWGAGEKHDAYQLQLES